MEIQLQNFKSFSSTLVMKKATIRNILIFTFFKKIRQSSEHASTMILLIYIMMMIVANEAGKILLKK